MASLDQRLVVNTAPDSESSCQDSGCEPTTPTRMDCAITFWMSAIGVPGSHTPPLEKVTLHGNGPLVVYVPAATSAVSRARPAAQYVVRTEELATLMGPETPCFAVQLTASDRNRFAYVLRYMSIRDQRTRVVTLTPNTVAHVGGMLVIVKQVRARLVSIRDAPVIAPTSPALEATAAPSDNSLVRFGMSTSASARVEDVPPPTEPHAASLSPAPRLEPAYRGVAPEHPLAEAQHVVAPGGQEGEMQPDRDAFYTSDFHEATVSFAQPLDDRRPAALQQMAGHSVGMTPAASSNAAQAGGAATAPQQSASSSSDESDGDDGDGASDSDYDPTESRRKKATRRRRKAPTRSPKRTGKSPRASPRSVGSGARTPRSSGSGRCLRLGCERQGYCQVPATICVNNLPPATTACQNCYVWLRRHFGLDKTKCHVRCNHYEGIVTPMCQRVIAEFEHGGARFATRAGTSGGPAPSEKRPRETAAVAGAGAGAGAGGPAAYVDGLASATKRARRTVRAPQRFSAFANADELSDEEGENDGVENSTAAQGSAAAEW